MTDRIDPSRRPETQEPADPRLRELFQALPRRRAAGEECPEPAELWASARGEVDPARNRWLIAHTGRCTSCAEDWRLARHLERDRAESAEHAFDQPWDRSAARARAGGSAPGLQRLALAATVILAVAIAALWAAQAGLKRQQTVDRSDDRTTIESLTPEDRPLSRDLPVLQWAAPERVEGVRYDVTVTDERLSVVAQADRLTDPEYRLPDEVVAGLRPGTTLLWKVEARWPDGASARSPTYRVRLE